MSKTFRMFMPDHGVLIEKEVYRRHLLVGERAVVEGLANLSEVGAGTSHDRHGVLRR